MTDDTLRKRTASETQTDEALPDERMFHEINLLRLEGYVFCLDPKEAGRRHGKREFLETLKHRGNMEARPVVIEINPTYGQPSTVAYKVLQAIIKKISDYGLPATNTVYFSQRELVRLIGRSSFGANAQKQVFNALMQLRDTKILCWFYAKDTDTWMAADFQILDSTIFSGRAQRITQCAVKLNDFITQSLNNRYTICLNYSHLEQLEPIAAALYKHLFFHFSNIYSATKRPDFCYNKNYEKICGEWLGGLKVLPYRSKIEKEQLGRHFSGLKKLKFVKQIEIQKNAKGDGFNVVFTPGKAFFQDYARFYKKQLQLSIQFHKEADKRRHGDPLSLVQLFYEKLYGKAELTPTILSDKETDLARMLLSEYSYNDLEDLITYTLAEASQTGFEIKTFGGIRSFVQAWRATRSSRLSAQQDRAQGLEEEVLQERYDAFREQQIMAYRDALDDSERTDLEFTIREQIEREPGPAYTHDMLFRVRLNAEIARRLELPSFDEWKSRQRVR